MQASLEAIHANCIEEGECWLWQGALSHGTTPTMRLPGTRRQASVRRMVLELQGIVLGKRKAFPCCGNSACVSPACTKAMTHAEMLTRVAQRSGYAHNLARNSKIAAGKRKNSPLTPELVEEIRSSPESGHAIARRLGFNQSTVQAIRAHESWRNYSNPFFQLVG
jgi:hypothetical protein